MDEMPRCGVCHGWSLFPVLDMGEQPLAERDDGRRYPLQLRECATCGLVQLSHSLPQRDVFPESHPYTTGASVMLRRHFSALASEVGQSLGPGDLVVDIGANDGTFLSCLPESVRRLAVEPTGQAAKCEAAGLLVRKSFFTRRLAEEILRDHGPARAVVACNVLAHVPDPHDFVAGARLLLGSGGVFITESHDFSSVSEGLQIDTVYHEHLRYLTPATVGRLLAAHGLDMRESRPVGTHGGSFRVTAVPRRHDLRPRAERAAAALRALLEEVTDGGARPIPGIGAATRATPLIHYARIAPYLSYVCETPRSEKIGMRIPGTGVEVVPDARLAEEQPGHAVLFSWHLASDIVPSLRRLGYRGKIIVPLPEPGIWEG